MNEKLFNQWADSYDASIKESEKQKQYPFYGYGKIQEYIFKEVTQKEEAKILEMGIGTGMITKKLYDEGYDITGVDFSTGMLEKAKKIMPGNTYIQTDFLNAISHLKNKRYDVIIFSYSIHHLSYTLQVELLTKLTSILNTKGIIIIGDVMTDTIDDMTALSIQCGSSWDDEEFYPTHEHYKLLENVYSLNYTQLTYCSGIMTLEKL